MKMGSKLEEKEIREYSELVNEFSDTFAWSHDELKGIPTLLENRNRNNRNSTDFCCFK